MKKSISAKEARVAGKKLSEDIYLNKRKREKIRKDFLRLQKSLLISVDTTEKPITRDDYDRRKMEISVANLSVVVIETIEDAKQWDKEITLSDCKYKLFKNNKKMVFEAKFKKLLLDDSVRTTYIYLPQGLPKNNKKKAYKIKEKFDLSGFTKVDQGIFIQKITDLKTMSLNFEGRNKKVYLICKLINDQSQTYWAKDI